MNFIEATKLSLETGKSIATPKLTRNQVSVRAIREEDCYYIIPDDKKTPSGKYWNTKVEDVLSDDWYLVN